MEYANKIGSPAVILYGDDEKKDRQGNFEKSRNWQRKLHKN